MIKTDVLGGRDEGLSEKRCASCDKTWIVAHRVKKCPCGGDLETLRDDVSTNELRRQLLGRK